MARIIKSTHTTKGGVPAPVATQYDIVGEKPLPLNEDEEDDEEYYEYPHGSIHLTHHPQQFHNFFSEPNSRHSAEKVTGLDLNYLREHEQKAHDRYVYLRDTGENVDDKLLNKSNAINSLLRNSSYFDSLPTPADSQNNQSLPNRRLTGIDLARSYNSLRKDHPEVLHPDALFRHQPARTVVDKMFVHPDLKISGPIALADAHRNFGELTAAWDLSEYSSRLTQHAQEMGLPVKSHPNNPNSEQRNDISQVRPVLYRDSVEDLLSPEKVEYDYSTTERRELTPQEVRSAKNHLRDLTGRTKKANMSPQFNHPTLFGDDNG